MLWEHEPTGESFHSFFEFSQTSMRVQLVYFDHQSVNSPCSHHHYGCRWTRENFVYFAKISVIDSVLQVCTVFFFVPNFVKPY